MAPRALVGLLELAGLSFLNVSLMDIKSGEPVATMKVSAESSKPLVPWQQNTTQYNFALDVPEDVGSFVLQSATPDVYLYNDYWGLDQRPMRRWYTDFHHAPKDAASAIQKVFSTRAVRYSVLCCADHNGNGKCDGEEEAVAGCHARLTPVQPLSNKAISKWALPSILATSGADGLLTFYPPANYTFGVELVDWPAALVPDPRSASATFLTSRVQMTPAALEAPPADLFLLSTRKVKVSGSVRDEVGSPIAGAVVAVTHGDVTVKTVTDVKGFYTASARSGSKLTLSLAALPAGYVVPTRGGDVEYTSANADVFVGFTLATPTDAFRHFCDSIDKTTLYTFEGRRLGEATVPPTTGATASEASVVSPPPIALANNQGAGGILGQVVDSKGLGVGGAVISLSGPKLPIPLTTLTNENGVFAYPSLPMSVGTDSYIVQFAAVPAGSKLMHRLNGAREVNVIPDAQALVYFQACGEAVSVKYFAPAPGASRPQAPVSSASAALIEAFGSSKPADPPGV